MNDLVGIIVDSGHGGIDSGAVGNNLQEKDLNLRAGKYIYNRLQELGIPAVLTREDDEYLPKADRIKKVLSLYNNSPNTILVSNHINAGGAEGAEVVYSLKNNSTLADLVLNNIGEAGQVKRKTYQRRLPENPNKDYYYILRESGNTEPILIEYGFIDNVKDAEKLENNLLDYAEGVVEAVSDYIGINYQPPGNIPSTGGDLYTVKRGDTLYSIARRFDISVDKIKQLNNLKDNNISVGQTLKLEEQTIDYPTADTYIVKRGDTLYSIALSNNLTIDELKTANNLTGNTLQIGQQLIIPDSMPKPDYNFNDYIEYTVKRGDSLWQISKQFNIPLPELISLNNLTDLSLQIGQKLIVPNNGASNEEIYIVKAGDTLWSVAKNNNISVAELKKLNNLDSNLLSIGQQLKLK